VESDGFFIRFIIWNFYIDVIFNGGCNDGKSDFLIGGTDWLIESFVDDFFGYFALLLSSYRSSFIYFLLHFSVFFVLNFSQS